MKKLTADFILGPDGDLLKNHTLLVDGARIVDLLSGTERDVIFFEGILCPGFINTHCHLELSHLKNKIPKGTNLDGFIRDFVIARKTHTHGVEESIAEANVLMWQNGIQAVGDICNSDITFQIKKNSKLRYHSFIELFNMDPDKANETFAKGRELYDDAIAAHKFASIVPHAPYSVPEKLFKLIKDFHLLHHSQWSIHHQETDSENELFKFGTGALYEKFKNMGVAFDWHRPTGKNSTESITEYFPDNSHILLVHNTSTTQYDMDQLKKVNVLDRTWFCLCPNANLFIENRLPDIPLFLYNNCKITIGTDSLASNENLSVWDEIKTIHKSYPLIPVATLLTWATKNGAAYFGWNDLGAFRKGTSPGVINLNGVDESRIQSTAGVKRIM